jgi:hypothetical protein
MLAFAKKEGVKYSCLKLEKTDDDNYIIAIEFVNNLMKAVLNDF